MVSVPVEVNLIILEYLLEINPILCAKISKYWYYKAMPKIWGEVDLNRIPVNNGTKKRRNLVELSNKIQKRAYGFYNTYINPNRHLKCENAICLQYIKKLSLPYSFHTGTIINILKKCPNLEELNFVRTKDKNVPYDAVMRYCPKIQIIYIGSASRHNGPDDYLDGLIIQRA